METNALALTPEQAEELDGQGGVGWRALRYLGYVCSLLLAALTCWTTWQLLDLKGEYFAETMGESAARAWPLPTLLLMGALLALGILLPWLARRKERPWTRKHYQVSMHGLEQYHTGPATLASGSNGTVTFIPGQTTKSYDSSTVVVELLATQGKWGWTVKREQYPYFEEEQVKAAQLQMEAEAERLDELERERLARQYGRSPLALSQ